MKTFIFFILLFVGLVVVGQTQNNLQKAIDSLKTDIDNFYNGIDKTTMQTNIFFNQGFFVLNTLEDINNGLPVVSDNNKWLYLYNSVSNAFIDGTTYKLI